MSKSQVNKELDIETPNIYCKEIQLNKLHFETKDAIEEWVSKHCNKHWKDDIGMVSFCSYCYPECKDKVKFLLIVKIITWAFFLDDYLDSKPDQMKHWLKFIEAKRAFTDHYLEIMYEEIFNELEVASLSYNQKLRVKLALVKLVESYGISGNMRKKSMKITLTEFTSLRYADSFVQAMYVFVEWYLNIDVSLFWNIPVFQRFHERIADHAQIVNDIYSYKKELKKENNMDYTYMAILMERTSISFEESLKIAVERVGILEKEINGLVTEINTLSNIVPKVYIDHVITIIHGNHHWSKSCGRYKLSNYS